MSAGSFTIPSYAVATRKRLQERFQDEECHIISFWEIIQRARYSMLKHAVLGHFHFILISVSYNNNNAIRLFTGLEITCSTRVLTYLPKSPCKYKSFRVSTN